jgi:hypothetical protein
VRALFTLGFLSLTVGSSYGATVGSCDTPTESPLISTQDEITVVCVGDCTSLDPFELDTRVAKRDHHPIFPIGPRCLYAGPECEGIPVQSRGNWNWWVVTWIPTPELLGSRSTSLFPKATMPRYAPIYSQWQPATGSPPPRQNR